MPAKKHFYTRLGTLLWLLAAIFAFLPSWPYFYYRLSPKASQTLAQTIANTPKNTPALSKEGAGEGLKPPITTIYDPSSTVLPPLNLSLPAQNGLIIDKIGVKGEIHEGEDWQNILRKGIWRVPNFATPPEQNTNPALSREGVGEGFQPIILAAHRWGYLEWSAGFRKLNSFYNLPKLVVGDTIKIIWEQREYEYKVYATETGTSIPEYKANLILYTCQLWNSPVRFFVLANRVN